MPTPVHVCAIIFTGQSVLSLDLAPYPRSHVTGIRHKKKDDEVLAWYFVFQLLLMSGVDVYLQNGSSTDHIPFSQQYYFG